MKKLLQNSLVLLCMFVATMANAQFSQNGQRPTSSLQEKWRITTAATGAGAWRNEFRNTYTYPTTTTLNDVIEAWDTTAAVFKNSQKYLITANANNSINQFIIQKWVASSNTWANYYRIAYTYYNNDPAKILVQTTDTAASATTWNNYFRQTNTYNASGFKTQELSEFKSGATWANSSRTTYVNNAAGYPTQETAEYYYSSAWYNNSRINYTYNAANKVTQKVDLSWDFVSAFNNSYRTNYTYTAANNIATELRDQWNGNTSVWEKYDKTNNTYNAANYLTATKVQEWDIATSAYRDFSSTDNTLNTSNNVTVELDKVLYANTNALLNSQRVTYQYQNVVATNDVVATAADFQLFPNPTTDQITVSKTTDDLATVFLTNAQGQVLTTRNVQTNQTQLDVQQLPVGVYHISVVQNGAISTHSFIKQ
jgi:hypothetical protein